MIIIYYIKANFGDLFYKEQIKYDYCNYNKVEI